METDVEPQATEPTSQVVYRIQSVCECQGVLTADLDAQRNVLAGWASRGRAREVSPANAVAPEHNRFDVVWKCPLCGRNTLRTFYSGALERA
jgi:hypothetical protein